MEAQQRISMWTSLVVRMFNALLRRDRFSLTAGGLLCALLSFWLADLLNVPATPYRAGCVLQQPNWPLALGLAWLLILGGSAVSAAIASRVHYDGAMFCVCAGLATLSLRFGPARYALLGSNSYAIYLTFAIELILLYAGLAVAWLALRVSMRNGWLPAEQPLQPDGNDEPLDQKLLATAAAAIIAIVLMSLLSQSDDKAQSLAAVALSSFLASLGANQFVPTGPSAWYWAAPLIVGLLGYVSQFFSPWDWQIGDARGYLASLARPTPLDYASAGPAGALLGYWTSRRWHKDKDRTKADTSAASAN